MVQKRKKNGGRISVEKMVIFGTKISNPPTKPHLKFSISKITVAQ